MGVDFSPWSSGSTAATFGEAGFADYAAAKAGLVGLARSLKNEIVALARDELDPERIRREARGE